MLRMFHHADFDATALAATKGGQAITVCLPARDEERTVGAIVERLRRDLVDTVPLVDEILVLDDHSSDRTAAVAAAAGARVVAAASVLPEFGTGHGKGEALWKSLQVAVGDLIVWCDADVRAFSSAFVVGLVGPLLHAPELQFVKGFYERPGGEDAAGGGRVTELVARPVISLLFPELAAVVQPLSGEYAGRRALLEQLPFVQGYGVDLGLLIDVTRRVGIEAVAQTDLGVRLHRNRSLDELAPQAMQVLQTALRRADPDLVGTSARLARPGQQPLIVSTDERPPLAALAQGGRQGMSSLRR
jgi:glucosyl-3-phosphoglycerate synthase